MAARAIWKGVLRLGKARLPVKLYSAAKDEAVHFHMLEGRTKTRVKQHMVDPETGDEVPRNQIRKGHEVEPDVFVILDEDEIESVRPDPTDDIETLGFVPEAELNHQWYERPYYVGPDGNEKDYFALAEALAETGKEGIVRWVMRGKEYVGALRAEGDYLALITLRKSEEVLSAKELPAPRGEVTAKELRMAQQLVSMLEGEFNPAEYHDEYRGRVQEFIEAKARGKRPRLEAVPRRRPSRGLEESLQKSISALTGPKGRKKVA